MIERVIKKFEPSSSSNHFNLKINLLDENPKKKIILFINNTNIILSIFFLLKVWLVAFL